MFSFHEMESPSGTKPAPVGRLRRSTSVPDMRASYDSSSSSSIIGVDGSGESTPKNKASILRKALHLSPLALRRPSLTSTPVPSSGVLPPPMHAFTSSQSTGSLLRKPAMPAGPRRSLPDFLPLGPPQTNRTLCRIMQEEDPKQELHHERSVMQNASLQRSFEVAMPSSPSPSVEVTTSPTQHAGSPSVYCLSPSGSSLTASMSPSSPRFLPRLASRSSSPCPSPTRRTFMSRLAPCAPILKNSPLDLKRSRRTSSSDADELCQPLAKRSAPVFAASSPRGSGAASPLLLNGQLSPRQTQALAWPYAEAAMSAASSLDDDRRWSSADMPSPMDTSGDALRRPDPASGFVAHPLSLASMAFSRDDLARRSEPTAFSSNSLVFGREAVARSEPINFTSNMLGNAHLLPTSSREEGQDSPMHIYESEPPWNFTSPRTTDG